MQRDHMISIRYITQAAVIAGMYAALAILFAPISSGQLQVRIAEALTVLPYFTPAALPGLFVGCLLSNIYVAEGGYDVLLGPLATLAAAYLSRKVPRRLVPLPPVIINALYVGLLLHVAADLPFILTVALVAGGQSIACYVLGYPLLLLLEKHRKSIFGFEP